MDDCIPAFRQWQATIFCCVKTGWNNGYLGRVQPDFPGQRRHEFAARHCDFVSTSVSTPFIQDAYEIQTQQPTSLPFQIV
jgi:hypothetical protein